MKRLIIFLFGLLPLLVSADHHQLTSKDYQLAYQVHLSDLNRPWAIVWLDATRSLISERNGDLLLIDNGKKIPLPLPEVKIYAYGQGGLFDLALHPQYADNGWIYLSFSMVEKAGITTGLARFKLVDNQLTQWQLIHRAQPHQKTNYHFGGRIVFDDQGYLYLSVGDRGTRDLAQDTNNTIGKILRLNDDGTVAKNNPFNNAVFSYGHRNPQGLIWMDGKLVSHEHGPKGGDELNIITRGANYGWPVITYGTEYTGGQIGEGTQKAGMQQPVRYWVPSIAPAGLARYQGQAFAKWQNNLLLGSLFGQLVRLSGDQADAQEERLLSGAFGRIRHVSVRDGRIFLLTDDVNGRLIEIKPIQ